MVTLGDDTFMHLPEKERGVGGAASSRDVGAEKMHGHGKN
jgi:hypothetical protein